MHGPIVKQGKLDLEQQAWRTHRRSSLVNAEGVFREPDPGRATDFADCFGWIGGLHLRVAVPANRPPIRKTARWELLM